MRPQNPRQPTIGVPGPTLDRRALVGGAVWATPAIVMAAAAPATAASLPACKPVQLVADWSSSSYVRTSATTGTYTWINPLGNGSIPVLTLTIAATVVGPTFTSLATADLTATAGPTGGLSVPGLDLSLNILQHTTNTTNTGADFTFAFSAPVTNLSTTITDIDGSYFNNNSNNSGAERVSLSSPSPISGTVTNSAYLTGSGTTADPWRRRPHSSPNVDDVAKTSSAGNVSVTSAALSQFTLSYRLLDNTTTVGGVPTGSFNLWLAPLTFTLLCP